MELSGGSIAGNKNSQTVMGYDNMSNNNKIGAIATMITRGKLRVRPEICGNLALVGGLGAKRQSDPVFFD